eukprot:TRINITY_DN3513_c0_g1_i2.p1 TRINITY_DN3513_c0_g1~~TRINITY_DN3513_c0_g1_i2.p1  ORF type:complete len:956 (-),score=284.43 TRINITY_DN3513_c0_g1_i2:126-2993(-)
MAADTSGADEEVVALLTKAGLGSYVDTFVEQGYDSMDVVLAMDESDLDACAMKPGHKLRFKLARKAVGNPALAALAQLPKDTQKQAAAPRTPAPPVAKTAAPGGRPRTAPTRAASAATVGSRQEPPVPPSTPSSSPKSQAPPAGAPPGRSVGRLPLSAKHGGAKAPPKPSAPGAPRPPSAPPPASSLLAGQKLQGGRLPAASPPPAAPLQALAFEAARAAAAPAEASAKIDRGRVKTRLCQSWLDGGRRDDACFFFRDKGWCAFAHGEHEVEEAPAPLQQAPFIPPLLPPPPPPMMSQPELPPALRQKISAARAQPGQPRPAVPEEEPEVNVVKIFVGGLPSSCDNDKLYQTFSQFGAIADHVVMMDKDNRKPRGFGYVTFRDASSVEAAMNDSRKHWIDNKWVEVKRCLPESKKKDKQNWDKKKKPDDCKDWDSKKDKDWKDWDSKKDKDWKDWDSKKDKDWQDRNNKKDEDWSDWKKRKTEDSKSRAEAAAAEADGQSSGPALCKMFQAGGCSREACQFGFSHDVAATDVRARMPQTPPRHAPPPKSPASANDDSDDDGWGTWSSGGKKKAAPPKSAPPAHLLKMSKKAENTSTEAPPPPRRPPVAPTAKAQMKRKVTETPVEAVPEDPAEANGKGSGKVARVEKQQNGEAIMHVVEEDATYQVGAAIECFCQERNRYISATVTTVLPDGMYGVEFGEAGADADAESKEHIVGHSAVKAPSGKRVRQREPANQRRARQMDAAERRSELRQELPINVARLSDDAELALVYRSFRVINGIAIAPDNDLFLEGHAACLANSVDVLRKVLERAGEPMPLKALAAAHTETFGFGYTDVKGLGMKFERFAKEIFSFDEGTERVKLREDKEEEVDARDRLTLKELELQDAVQEFLQKSEGKAVITLMLKSAAVNDALMFGEELTELERFTKVRAFAQAHSQFNLSKSGKMVMLPGVAADS